MTPQQLLNLALLKIGVSKGIDDLDEATREAYTGKLIYDHHLRGALRSYPWAFATKYLRLALVQGPAWAPEALVQAWATPATYVRGDVVRHGGVVYYAAAGSGPDALAVAPPAVNWSTTPTVAANGDWAYAYRWPSDCVMARRIVPPGTGRTFNDAPIRFRVGRDRNGLLLYSHEPDAELEYTTIDCLALWSDDLFLDCFTWRLAAALSPALSKIPKMTETCLAMYEHTRDIAAAVSKHEEQQDPPGEAEWIRGR